MKTNNFIAIVTWVNSLVVHGLADPGDDFGPRILHGQTVDASNYPFIAKLRINGESCGGSIISNYWVITAAHCLGRHPCSAVIIYPAMLQPTNGIRAASCHVHPDYRFDRTDNRFDISLLAVAQDLLQNGRVGTIPLPRPGTFYATGTPAVITGWGKTEQNSYPRQLLVAQVRVEDWNTCNEIFRRATCRTGPNCQNTIPYRHFCTQGSGFAPGGTCFGDSGGPVIINGVLAGVISFVITHYNNCVIRAPSMHVNVVDYLKWIYYVVDPSIDVSQMSVKPEY